MGLIGLRVDESQRRQGHATFLLGEAFKQIQSEGTTLVEVQIPIQEAAPLALFSKLGFEKVDEGMVLCKSIA